MQDSLKYKINYKLVVYVVGGKSERKYVPRLVRQYPFFHIAENFNIAEMEPGKPLKPY